MPLLPQSSSLEDLEELVGQLQTKIRSMEELISFHIGNPSMSGGAYPHPNQIVTSLTFGIDEDDVSNYAVWDTNGLQIFPGTTEKGTIWWLPSYSASPASVYPRASLTSSIGTASSALSLNLRSLAGDSAYLAISTDDALAYTGALMQSDLFTVGGMLRLKSVAKTISGGVLTLSGNQVHSSLTLVTNEGGAATDYLDTIDTVVTLLDGVDEGIILILRANDTTKTTIITNSGNITTADGKDLMLTGVKYVVFLWTSVGWIELTRTGSNPMREHNTSSIDNLDAASVGSDFWGAPFISSWNQLGTPAAMSAAYTSDPFSSTDFADYPAIDLNSNGDGIYSSDVGFGTWGHKRMAEGILGSEPTKLTLEWDAKWVTHTANESTSGLGFVVGGGSPLTAANHVAFIYSNGTNFALRSSGASDTGAADDGNWHKFKIVLDSAAVTAEWFIDGITQGTIALLQDTFPVIIGASVSTTNRIRTGWAHLYYE